MASSTENPEPIKRQNVTRNWIIITICALAIVAFFVIYCREKYTEWQGNRNLQTFKALSLPQMKEALKGFSVKEAKEAGWLYLDISLGNIYYGYSLSHLPKGDLVVIPLRDRSSYFLMRIAKADKGDPIGDVIREVLGRGSWNRMVFLTKKQALEEAPDAYNPTILIGCTLAEIKEAGLIELPDYSETTTVDYAFWEDEVYYCRVFCWHRNGQDEYYKFYWLNSNPQTCRVLGAFNSALIAKWANLVRWDYGSYTQTITKEEDLKFIGKHYANLGLQITKGSGSNFAMADIKEIGEIWFFILDDQGIVTSWMKIEGEIITSNPEPKATTP